MRVIRRRKLLTSFATVMSVAAPEHASNEPADGGGQGERHGDYLDTLYQRRDLPISGPDNVVAAHGAVEYRILPVDVRRQHKRRHRDGHKQRNGEDLAAEWFLFIVFALLFIFYLSRVEDKFSLVAEGSEVSQVAVRPSSPNLTATSIFYSSVGLPEKTHSNTRPFRVRQRGPEIVPPAVFIHKGQGEVEVPVHVADALVLDAEKARHRRELIGRDCPLVRSYIPLRRGHDYRHGAAHPGSEIGGSEAVFFLRQGEGTSASGVCTPRRTSTTPPPGASPSET